MNLKILHKNLFADFVQKIDFSILEIIDKIEQKEISFDYYQTNYAISSVFSSKIEGEEIELDSFFKHKFLDVKFLADYTKRTDDLFSAYEFMQENILDLDNIFEAHSILSENLLPKSQRGKVRQNQMMIVNNEGKIEYVATEKNLLKSELDKLFNDIEFLISEELSLEEIFYFASQIHLVFVKIHPFEDGNGRSARLLEKWFLKEFLGRKAFAIQLEKNYYENLQDYYKNLKKIGLEYIDLDYNKSLDFLLMTVTSLKSQS